MDNHIPSLVLKCLKFVKNRVARSRTWIICVSGSRVPQPVTRHLTIADTVTVQMFRREEFKPSGFRSDVDGAGQG